MIALLALIKTVKMIHQNINKLIALAAVLLSVSNTNAQLTVTNGANVYMSSGASVVVTGNMTNAGSVTGAGTLILSGTSLQTVDGTGSIDNLTLNNPAGATISSGGGNMQSLFGTLTLTNGLLTTDYNLTLKSNAGGTARIATITGGGITGNLIVERWIPATGRRYRLLTPTVTTTGSAVTSIKANWQEGQMNTTVGTNINNIPGYGTQITGNGGNTNGFDVTQTNAPSLYNTTNAIIPTYTAVGNTSGALNALTGYFLFIRGDRSMDMTLFNTNVPPMPMPLASGSTTLRATGAVQTGTITAFTNPLIGGGALNLITNPYPSVIDWSLVQPACTNITQFYTLWDASIGYRGGFVTVKTDGTLSDITSNATKYIQPGQAFFVQSIGAAPTVSIQEIHKSTGNNNGIYTPTPPPVESFATSLYYTEGSGYRRLADGVIAVYNNSYSAGLDGDDADEVNNWDENIAIARSGHHLSIESRPVIGLRDTISLFMNGMHQMNYEFEFTASNFSNPLLRATLVDSFTNMRTPLSVTGTTVVPFLINSIPASSASNRFMVVFGPFSPLAVGDITIKAYQKNRSSGQGGPGIQVDWVTITETDMDHYEVERSANGTQFSQVGSVVSLGNSNSPTSYGWFDGNPFLGFNYYRIKAIAKLGQIKYSAIVKVNIAEAPGTITVSPNPISGKIIKMHFTNMGKGVYNISLTNSAGQILFKTTVEHSGGSAVLPVAVQNNLPGGVYDLRISGIDVRQTIRIMKD